MTIQHHSHASKLFDGLTLQTWLTVCVALAAGLRVDLERPQYRVAAVVGAAGLGVLLVVVRSVRGVLADWVRDLGAQELMLAAVLHALLFFAPSLLMREWMPLTGFTALLVPATLAAVDEGGLARLRVLTAFILAMAAAQAPPWVGWVLWACWIPVVAAGMSIERAAFTLERHGSGSAPPVATLCSASIWRLLLAAILTLPIAGLVILLMPRSVGRAEGSRSAGPMVAPHRPGFSGDGGLASVFWLLALAILTVLVVAAIRKIRSMLRRSEADDVFPNTEVVGTEHVPAPLLHTASPQSKGPRDEIIAWYERLSDSLAPAGFGRRPAASPAEYADELRSARLVPDEVLGEITGRFVAARYAPGDPTDSEAEAFRGTIQSALALMRESRQDDGV